MPGKDVVSVRSVIWAFYCPLRHHPSRHVVTHTAPLFLLVRHLALQVLGDQVSFIVLRKMITSNEALLALGTLKTLVTCTEEDTSKTKYT